MVGEVRGHIDEYKHIFVLSFINRSEDALRQIRLDWKESKLFLGKRSIAQIALGRSVEEEYMDNLHQISEVCCD